MNRPPTPTQAIPGTPCPTCGALVPETTFDGCPVLLEARRKQAHADRMLGLERPSTDEAQIVARIFPEWGGLNE